MSLRSKTAATAAGVLVALACAAGVLAAEGPPAPEVLRETGVAAGLAVHVGTTDGVLEAGLTNGGKMLVQGLALSGEAAASARRHLFEQRLYGLASVARVETAATLPYYDRLVNLLVADLDALGERAPPMEEIRRVLGYGGAARVKKGGRWTTVAGPTSSDVDVWTHFAYDASRNGVSNDRLVGPPNAVRWLGGATGRNPIGGGRASDATFVHINRAYGEIARSDKRGPTALPWAPNVEGTVLWARDVSSGVLLWYRPICRGTGINYSFEFTDAFVAAGGRVYGYDFTAEDRVALTAWNLRTGAVERVFDKSRVFRKEDAPPPATGRKDVWLKKAHEVFASSTVLVHEGRAVHALEDAVFVMDAASGDLLWKKEMPEGTLCHKVLVSEDRLVALLGKAVADRKATPYEAVEAWRLADGRPVWRFTDLEGMAIPFFQAPNRITFGSRDRHLLIAGRKEKGEAFLMLDARTGARLWDVSNPVNMGFWTACIVGEEVWAAGYAFGAVFDLATGRQKFRFGLPNYGACATHFATPNYFGMKTKLFIPIAQPEDRGPRGVRFYNQRAIQLTCAEKLCPSYGSVFQIAPVCVCEAVLPGTAALYALGPTGPVADDRRLARGGAGALGPLEPQAEALKHPGALDWGKPEGVEKLLWSASMGKDPQKRDRRALWLGYGLLQTPPVEAGDLALAAHVHEHRLAASRGGREVWNFVAGGRIGSPPVVHKNLAIFGCHDGYAYAVNLADGSPAWRFLAAPADRRHVVMGQVESAWPVFNVVLHEGRLYFSAGRHPELDGGVHFYCLEPATGALEWHVKHRRGLSTETLTPRRSSASTMAKAHNEPVHMDTTWIINDAIEVRDGKVWLGELDVVDLADPKDTIINPETLVLPGSGDT